jgi:hypothetical protein
VRSTSIPKWQWAIFRKEGMQGATVRQTAAADHANFGIWVKFASASQHAHDQFGRTCVPSNGAANGAAPTEPPGSSAAMAPHQAGRSRQRGPGNQHCSSKVLASRRHSRCADGLDVDVTNPSQLRANSVVIKFVQRCLDERLDPASNLLANLFECGTLAFI